MDITTHCAVYDGMEPGCLAPFGETQRVMFRYAVGTLLVEG